MNRIWKFRYGELDHLQPLVKLSDLYVLQKKEEAVRIGIFPVKIIAETITLNKAVSEKATDKTGAIAEEESAKEAALQKFTEEVALKKVFEEEEAKKLLEEAALKKVAEAGLKKVTKEVALIKIVEEEEAKKVLEEAALKKITEEAALKKFTEEAALKKVTEEAALKKVLEEEGKKLLEEAAIKVLEEAAKKVLEEAALKEATEKILEDLLKLLKLHCEKFKEGGFDDLDTILLIEDRIEDRKFLESLGFKNGPILRIIRSIKDLKNLLTQPVPAYFSKITKVMSLEDFLEQLQVIYNVYFLPQAILWFKI